MGVQHGAGTLQKRGHRTTCAGWSAVSYAVRGNMNWGGVEYVKEGRVGEMEMERGNLFSAAPQGEGHEVCEAFRRTRLKRKKGAKHRNSWGWAVGLAGSSARVRALRAAVRVWRVTAGRQGGHREGRAGGWRGSRPGLRKSPLVPVCRGQGRQAAAHATPLGRKECIRIKLRK